MLFDVKQFEQFFTGRPLQKGLSHFEKGELEFIERHGQEYHFHVKGEDLYVTKKGDKLLSYTCSCQNKIYCGHLSAALFYFQQEALGVSVKSNAAVKKKNPTGKRITVEDDLKKVEQEDLLAFISVSNNHPTETQIERFLRGKSTLRRSDIYQAQFNYLLEPFLQHAKLVQKQIEDLRGKMSGLIKKIKRAGKNKDSAVCLELAIVRFFLPLFNLRFAGDEKALFDIYHNAIAHLETVVKKLSTDERADWHATTLFSIATNKNLQSEAFFFFIPRLLSWMRKETELKHLAMLLKKRNMKIPYSQQLDKLRIVSLEVKLRHWDLFRPGAIPDEGRGEIELIIARVELDLCSGKINRAFKHLEAHYEKVKLSNKKQYGDYLGYLLVKAEAYGKKELELKYLREGFMQRLFILPVELERFSLLTPAKEFKTEIRELVNQLGKERKGYYFDKMATLLTKADLLEELIAELKKQNDKFSLVHEIALKKFPNYDTDFLKLYLAHLAGSLSRDVIYSHQLKIFNSAKHYLDRLPPEASLELIKNLLDQLGKTGHIYRHINETYDYPFLKEENNY